MPIKIDRRDFNRELRIRREQKTLRNKKYLASSYGLSIRAAILKQIIFESPPLETDNIINFIKKKNKTKKRYNNKLRERKINKTGKLSFAKFNYKKTFKMLEEKRIVLV